MILPYMDRGRLEVDGSGHIVTPDNRLMKTTVHIVIAILPEAKHIILQ